MICAATYIIAPASINLSQTGREVLAGGAFEGQDEDATRRRLDRYDSGGADIVAMIHISVLLIPGIIPVYYSTALWGRWCYALLVLFTAMHFHSQTLVGEKEEMTARISCVAVGMRTHNHTTRKC